MRAGPVNSTRRSSANDPNAANRLTWGSEKQTWVTAKADGHHDRGPHRALDHEQVGILGLQPPGGWTGTARSGYRRRGGVGHKPAPIISEPGGVRNPAADATGPEDDHARSGDSVPRDGRRGDPSGERSGGISPRAGHGSFAPDGEFARRLAVSLRAAAPAPHRAPRRRRLRGGVQRDPHGAVPTLEGRRD